jgi:hypothetical protein
VRGEESMGMYICEDDYDLSILWINIPAACMEAVKIGVDEFKS